MNQQPQLYTFKQAVKALNNICTGLGDAFEANANDPSIIVDEWIPTNKKEKYTLEEWLIDSFWWDQSPEGNDNWDDTHETIRQFERGFGCSD